MSAEPAATADSGRVAGWFRGYRSALGRRDLRLLLSAEVISLTGGWAYNVALLAFVFERTHSLGWVGAAGLVRFIPALAFSAFGGLIAERVERVRLMMGADILCALWQGGASVLVATNGPVVAVLVLAALSSATTVVYSPAVAATIPSLVSEDDLVAANALNDTIDNLVVIVGPAIGAVLLLVGSPAVAFAVNAGSFVVSAALVSRIHTRTRPSVIDGGARGVLRQLADGVRTIVSLPAARTLVAFSALVSFVYGTDSILLVGVSAHRLGTGARGFGYLLAGIGLGGVVMALAMDRLSRLPRLALIILIGTAGYCLPTALLTLIHSPELAFALQILRGGSTLVVDVLAVTALQRAVPDDQLGRVFGIFFAFILTAISLGTLITPVVVSALGLNGALLVMAFAPVALGLLGYPALLAIDRQAAGRAAQLAPRVAVLEQLEIFASASRGALERLASSEHDVHFSAGNGIVREGEPAEAFYVLVDGQVDVTARGEGDGPERHIRTMTAPSYFGEIGVLGRSPRTATVTALSECHCARIEGDVLLEALTAAPPSTSLMENARSRLALTHPSRTFSPADPVQ